jgi:hypothetical protein
MITVGAASIFQGLNNATVSCNAGAGGSEARLSNRRYKEESPEFIHIGLYRSI